MELGMYEEALSILNWYTDYRLDPLAEKKVALLRYLKRWVTLSKFLRRLESDRWFDKWNPMLNVYLALSYCELGRFDELEEVVLAGLSKSPQGEEGAHLHLLLAIAMAKQSRISSALTECQKAIQLGREDDERIQWSGIGCIFLEYGEYEVTSICLDLETRSITTNSNNGEATILVQYRVQCNACSAEDFPLKRHPEKAFGRAWRLFQPVRKLLCATLRTARRWSRVLLLSKRRPQHLEPSDKACGSWLLSIYNWTRQYTSLKSCGTRSTIIGYSADLR